MNTAPLKEFARKARAALIEQVAARLAYVLLPDSTERRLNAHAVARLERDLEREGHEALVERLAYTWFNRFSALRYLDLCGLSPVRAVSPAEGREELSLPELLMEAKLGTLPEQLMTDEACRARVDFLLSAQGTEHHNPQGEAYRILLICVCNYWSEYMPYLFRPLDDRMGLLMPDDLLSSKSILSDFRRALTPTVCREGGVETLGWLYQFYVSEKKSAVMEEKRHGKIASADIPAATQIFTPDWIARYLTQNSLGRLWMLNRPTSTLAERMEFYLTPETPQTDFLRVSSPEELKVCDPACGSGHILTYAFDLLYEIYAEEGYAPAEIPALILKNNLYGMELDERAGQIAAFALAMKACERNKRFLRKKILPHICVLKAVEFDEPELDAYLNEAGSCHFPDFAVTALTAFREADNFGSLIRPPECDAHALREMLTRRNICKDDPLYATHVKALHALKMAAYLSPRYHAVIANPPYMIAANMNARLNAWLKEHYAHAGADLFAAFMVRNTELTLPGGQLGFMTPFVWMFISSYAELRAWLLKEKNLSSLVQLEKNSFGDAAVSICAFTVENRHSADFRGAFIKLTDFYGSEQQAPHTLEAVRRRDCGWRYTVNPTDFLSLAGAPLAYWLSPATRRLFTDHAPLADYAAARNAMKTGKNDRFLRLWHEVERNRIGFGMRSHREAAQSGKKWFPYNKGGGNRKWYGNHEYVLDWENGGAVVMGRAKKEGRHVQDYPHELKFTPVVSWSLITGAMTAFRFYPAGFIADIAGMCAGGGDEAWKRSLLAYVNTNCAQTMTRLISSTINFQTGDFGKLPYPEQFWGAESAVSAERLIDIAREDWNSYETSWDFTDLPLLRPEFRRSTLADSYAALRANRQEMTDETAALEEANNRRFNALYGLGDEFPVTVPPQLITLTCNPAYRYGGDKSAPEQEALMLADTMRELISYAVGCMFGRFSCAETAETDGFYVADNVLPIQNEDWFANDMAARFKTFLIATFSAEKIEENIRFIEQALNVKNRRHYTLRDYFNNEFYADHVKRYSKRPIYWLFSSAKGGFKALIYLHRYRPDTVDVILNDYLRPLRLKLAARRERMENAPLTAADRKRLDQLIRLQNELAAYETDVLFPLAQNKVELDLDNGVRVNYLKLGAALKPLE